MKLSKFVGKNVKIVDIDGIIWTGHACAFVKKIDTDEELYDEIDIDVITSSNGAQRGDLVSFYENEIEKIEVIE